MMYLASGLCVFYRKPPAGNRVWSGVESKMADEDVDTLRMVIDIHRQEIRHHESMAGNIFNWSAGVLLALGGGILALANTQSWQRHPYWGWWQMLIRLSIGLLSATIFYIAATSIRRRYVAANENARVISKVSGLLGLAQPGRFAPDPIYKHEWLEWGTPTRVATKFSPVDYTVLLALIALSVIVVTMVV